MAQVLFDELDNEDFVSASLLVSGSLKQVGLLRLVDFGTTNLYKAAQSMAGMGREANDVINWFKIRFVK